MERTTGSSPPRSTLAATDSIDAEAPGPIVKLDGALCTYHLQGLADKAPLRRKR